MAVGLAGSVPRSCQRRARLDLPWSRHSWRRIRDMKIAVPNAVSIKSAFAGNAPRRRFVTKRGPCIGRSSGFAPAMSTHDIYQVYCGWAPSGIAGGGEQVPALLLALPYRRTWNVHQLDWIIAIGARAMKETIAALICGGYSSVTRACCNATPKEPAASVAAGSRRYLNRPNERAPANA